MTWIACRVEGCGLDSEFIGRQFALSGVGFRGQDIVVWFERRVCAAGHQYQVELFEEDADE